MLVHAFLMCRLVVPLCEIRYSHVSVTLELYVIVRGCKFDHITAALLRELHWLPLEREQRILNYLCPSYNHYLFQTYKPVRSFRSSTMNLLISDSQIKAKILSGDHAFSFCARTFGMIPQSTYSVKQSLNIRSSKNNLKALETSKLCFYFVVLFNNFSIFQFYELLLSSRLS